MRRSQHPVFWVYNLLSNKLNPQTQHVGSLGPTSIKHFHNMTQSPSHSLKSFYNVPTLSAIVHESNALNFEDGFFLPSSFHGRTWLLDNFQETCTENTSCKVPRGEQELGTGDSCVQSAYLRRVVQETCPDFKPCEKTACQSGRPLAALECVSQPCQSGSSQQVGFAVQTCQPLSNMAKCCPPKTYVSKGCQTLECDSSQCQSRTSESHSCSPLGYVTPEPELLGSSSNTYEPICCVTGGLQLPSKWQMWRMCREDRILIWIRWFLRYLGTFSSLNINYIAYVCEWINKENFYPFLLLWEGGIFELEKYVDYVVTRALFVIEQSDT